MNTTDFTIVWNWNFMKLQLIIKNVIAINDKKKSNIHRVKYLSFLIKLFDN